MLDERSDVRALAKTLDCDLVTIKRCPSPVSTRTRPHADSRTALTHARTFRYVTSTRNPTHALAHIYAHPLARTLSHAQIHARARTHVRPRPSRIHMALACAPKPHAIAHLCSALSFYCRLAFATKKSAERLSAASADGSRWSKSWLDASPAPTAALLSPEIDRVGLRRVRPHRADCISRCGKGSRAQMRDPHGRCPRRNMLRGSAWQSF